MIGIGHSMGATTTLRLALRQPERFQLLVLIDPVMFPPLTGIAWNIIFRLGLAYQLHPLVKRRPAKTDLFREQFCHVRQLPHRKRSSAEDE